MQNQNYHELDLIKRNGYNFSNSILFQCIHPTNPVFLTIDCAAIFDGKKEHDTKNPTGTANA